MSHEPVDLLIIMLGTNDTKERFGASAECIALGLKRLISKAVSTTDCWKNGRPSILIVTPQNIDKRYETSEVGGTMGKGCAEKSGYCSGRTGTSGCKLGCKRINGRPC